VEPEILTKYNLLNPKFEKQYEDFNLKNKELIDYIKTTPTKAVTLNIRKGLPLEGNYSIQLDINNQLAIKHLT
jgi:hypothetical protein